MRKEIVLRILVTKEEQTEIQTAATREDRSVSAWLRYVGLGRARRDAAGTKDA
jgi:hypothetical protein